MFVAEEVAISLIGALRPVLGVLRQHDRALEDQARRAASSVALNLGEGRAREGKDRLHMFRTARGSARELMVALRIAEAWGYVAPPALAPVHVQLERMLRLLWGLTRPRG